MEQIALECHRAVASEDLENAAVLDCIGESGSGAHYKVDGVSRPCVSDRLGGGKAFYQAWNKGDRSSHERARIREVVRDYGIRWKGGPMYDTENGLVNML